jgi:hypothetical protein
MDEYELRLRVEVPDVKVEEVIQRVRCGASEITIKEHGHQGSGAWGTWDGNSLLYPTRGPEHPTPGTRRYSREIAIQDATIEVRHRERARLFQFMLREQLDSLTEET